jgi:hypothetical protein
MQPRPTSTLSSPPSPSRSSPPHSPIRVIRGIRGQEFPHPFASQRITSQAHSCTFRVRLPPRGFFQSSLLNLSARGDIMNKRIHNVLWQLNTAGRRNPVSRVHQRDAVTTAARRILSPSSSMRQNQNRSSFAPVERTQARRSPRRAARARDKTFDFWHAHVGPPARGAKSKNERGVVSGQETRGLSGAHLQPSIHVA